jgi:protein-L-isoaspartate(D-aspartate) O-methyltransferase
MVLADRARVRMVDALRNAGRVRTAAIEEAFRAVPRHLFLPGLPVDQAYADEAVAVQYTDGVATSSASQPSMMAIMLEQLDLRPGLRVLEIGAGTGYNAALMARIVGPKGGVTAVDIDEELVEKAADHLAAAGATGVELVAADGAHGHLPGAPYDRIVLTVGSDDVRPEWIEQLVPGGRLLLPLDVRGSQLSIALDLGDDGVLRSDSVRSCAFIRLRGAGAGSDGHMLPAGAGLAVQVPHDRPDIDPIALAAALATPGERFRTPVVLGPVDVWDGFGLWLTLTEPGACRLLAVEPHPALPDDLLPLGTTSGSVALRDHADGGIPGIAVVVRPRDARSAVEVAVRAFGPGGSTLAAQLVDALDRWHVAGRPGGSDWRITVVPCETGYPLDPVPPGAAVVAKPYCRLLIDLPGVPAR